MSEWLSSGINTKSYREVSTCHEIKAWGGKRLEGEGGKNRKGKEEKRRKAKKLKEKKREQNWKERANGRKEK